MRIAVWHNLPSGGGKRALFNHVAGLVSRGHTVEAWCPPTADQTYLPLSEIIREHVLDLALPSSTLSDKLNLTLPLKRQIEAMDAHCRACAAQIDRANFDIVFANSCKLFRATSIGRFARTPSVIYLGEPFRSLYEAQPRLWWLARPRDHKAPGRAISSLEAAFKDARSMRNRRFQAREEVDNAAAFDRILVNSFFSRESVLRAYGIDSDICYLGIDTDAFFDQELPRTQTVVGLGSLRREKNVRLCIEALATVPAPRPALVWVANAASPDYLAEMVAFARARDVAFTPKIGIPDTELLDILNGAQAMLYAPFLEPFGLAPLEANACGTPVIAVAEGGVRETVVDGVTGLLVHNDPASMGQAIVRLVRDPTLARELGRNGRRHVQQSWSMEAAIDRLENLLVRYAQTGSGLPA